MAARPSRWILLSALAFIVVVAVAVGAVVLHATGGKSKRSRVAATPVAAAPTLTAPSPTATPTPSPAQQAAQLKQNLTKAWAAALTGSKLKVQIAVHDTATGQTVSTSTGSGQHVTASIMKLSILERLLDSTSDDLSAGRKSLAERMISVSDNNAATALFRADGGATGVQSYFSKLGLGSTTASTSWGLTTTTAEDQLAVVDAFAHAPGQSAAGTPASGASVLAADDASEVGGYLDDVVDEQHWGVSGGVPKGVTVQLKNGWLPRSNGWTVNSIGHVHGGGVDYTIAVLTTGATTEQRGIDQIEALSKATFEQLAGS